MRRFGAANADLTAQSRATQDARGRVTAVAADSVTIQTSTESLTLFVDSSTRVIGKGVGKITERFKAEAGDEYMEFEVTNESQRDQVLQRQTEIEERILAGSV